MRLTFGVDPGLSGAIAVLGDGEYLDCLDMPTVGRGRKVRQWIDTHALAGWIREVRAVHAGAVSEAVIEEVQNRPGEAGRAGFRFGCSVGCVDGVLGGVGMPFRYVRPQVWKEAMGLIGTEKDAARVMAADLFPDAPLSRKRDQGRADALLMARWAWQQEAA